MSQTLLADLLNELEQELILRFRCTGAGAHRSQRPGLC